jgi:hypothetical protein
VTPEWLFGEDANRNGLLDPNENDAELSSPLDNPDGALDRGWSAFLTVFSREANVRADGTPRINVNQEDLAALYDALLKDFDEETARFVTAMRIEGPTGDDEEGRGDEEGGGDEEGDEDDGGGSDERERGRDSESRGGRGSSDERGESQSDGSGSEGGANVTRGGLDLSAGGGQTFNSLFDLVGATVSVEVNGQEQELESPWPDDPSSLTGSLPELLDKLAIVEDEFIEGRINISQAPREVLLTIPDIDEQLVSVIIGAQVSAGGAAVASDALRASGGWLLAEGHVDLEQMRALDQFIGGSGDVYRVQVLGYFGQGGPVTRLEALIDATQSPPKIVSVRDLTTLGWGYSASQISQPAVAF